MEFLNSRRQDIDLRPSYVNQLASCESRLFKIEENKSTKWDDNNNTDIEEHVLRNT